MKKEYFDISARLKELRSLNSITAKALCQKTGINLGSYNNYEGAKMMASLRIIEILSSFFNISIDFLLAWNDCLFPRSIKMLKLAEKIDKMNELKRFQIETTANTFLTGMNLTEESAWIDNEELDLTNNFNQNLRTIRKEKGIYQKDLAVILKIPANRIAYYEKNQIPMAEMLLQISEYFKTSVHAMTTGEKLCYDFENRDLLRTILKADKFLSLEKKEILITIMEQIAK